MGSQSYPSQAGRLTGSRRLQKFVTIRCPRGPLFSVTRSISGLRWAKLDDEYWVLCLGGRKVHFWLAGCVDTLTVNKSRRKDVVPAEIVMGSFLAAQTETLAELTGPHYPTPPPGSNRLHFISVPGKELVSFLGRLSLGRGSDSSGCASDH